MRTLLLTIALAGVLPGPAAAATYYVRAGASGSSCSDWNTANACPVMPTNTQLARLDTVYIADGAYNEFTFSEATSGTLRITVKKATVADHGTSTGWLDEYGDGSATFTRWIISSNYWTFDGQVGQCADTLYGVPGVCPPGVTGGYIPHGFKVLRSTVDDGTGSVIGCGSSGTPRDQIIIRHTEAAYTNTPRSAVAWGAKGDSSSIIGSNCPNVTLQYVWFHDGGSVVVFQRGAGTLAEYSIFERNGHAQIAGNYASPEHSELIDLTLEEGGVNPTFRCNVFRDWRATGGIIVLDHDIADGIRIYRNVFATTGYWNPATEGAGGNGVIANNNASTVLGATVAHNTFAGLAYDAKIYVDSADSFPTATVKNNLFDNVGTMLFGSTNITRDYNWYRLAGTQSETNIQNGSGDPFVDRANGDWRLTADTNPGQDLGAPYTTTCSGGTSTTFTRGAFDITESDGGSPSPSPRRGKGRVRIKGKD